MYYVLSLYRNLYACSASNKVSSPDSRISIHSELILRQKSETAAHQSYITVQERQITNYK